MEEKKILYANCFIPDYAKGDLDYSPWVVTHEDSSKVDNEVIERLWDEYTYENDLLSPDIIDDFYGYLESLGYGVYQHLYRMAVLGFEED